MRSSLRAALIFACSWSLAATASAQILEPNGLSVPRASSNASEQSLASFFASRGESIDWINDAHTTPNVFSPLCGFTATFVLNEAGSHFGLAWYNDTGSPPPPSDLHVLVPANSAINTMFTGTDIRNDPAYTGGNIGFALVGGETHYTNAAYDNVCTSCAPPGPWITALVYQSTTTPNAYYVGFEDGGTSASSWNNDGDFNDDVFFITGVTCSGGGAPCDTHMQGVCAQGVEVCVGGGSLECRPVVPSGTETCNGVDDDCDGMVDGDGLCSAGFVCQQGSCVHACDTGEFACNGGLVCNADGYCVDSRCATVTCGPGTVCHGGTCRAPCDDVMCPFGTVCRVDRCVDPCDTLTCPSGQVCDAGLCVEVCTCRPCAGSLACDAASGRCVPSACVGVPCGSGTHCDPASGSCVDDCAGATCPPGQLCSAGACVPDPCATVTCTGGDVCRAGACVDPCDGVTCSGTQVCVGGTCTNDPCAGVTCSTGTHCSNGSCVADGVDGGFSVDGGGAFDGGRDAGVRGPPTSGGCCSVIGSANDRAGALLTLLWVLGWVLRRRSR